MQHERASPGVQGENKGRARAEILRIAQQFSQRVAHRGEEDPRHRNAIERPRHVQLMRDGEDQVVVRAGKRPRLLRFEPAFGRDRLALRAAALVTRVVPGACDVPFGATLDVAAQRDGAAVRQPVGGAMDIQRQPMRLGVACEVLLKYRA